MSLADQTFEQVDRVEVPFLVFWFGLEVPSLSGDFFFFK